MFIGCLSTTSIKCAIIRTGEARHRASSSMLCIVCIRYLLHSSNLCSGRNERFSASLSISFPLCFSSLRSAWMGALFSKPSKEEARVDERFVHICCLLPNQYYRQIDAPLYYSTVVHTVVVEHVLVVLATQTISFLFSKGRPHWHGEFLHSLFISREKGHYA